MQCNYTFKSRSLYIRIAIGFRPVRAAAYSWRNQITIRNASYKTLKRSCNCLKNSPDQDRSRGYLLQGAIARFPCDVLMAAIGTCTRKAGSQSHALSKPRRTACPNWTQDGLQHQNKHNNEIKYRAKLAVCIEIKIEMNSRQVPIIHHIPVNIQVRALFI